jgi:hypothetical protein
MKLPTVIIDAEQLGRALFDGKDLKNALKGKFSHRRFIERPGVVELSVDRLNFGNHDHIARYQDQVRGSHCHGWAVITAHAVRSNEQDVFADPITEEPKNPYHAYIQLPTAATCEETQAKQYEFGLAMSLAASWTARPQGD